MADLREMRLFADTYLPFFERADGHPFEIQEGFVTGLTSFANPLDSGELFTAVYGEKAMNCWEDLQAILPHVEDPMFLCSGILGHAQRLFRPDCSASLTSSQHRFWFRMSLTRLREIADSLYPQSLQSLSQASRLTVTSFLPPDMPDEPASVQTLIITSDGNVQILEKGPEQKEESFSVDRLTAEQLLGSVPLFIEHYTAEYISFQGTWELKLDDGEGHFCAINGCLTSANDLFTGMSTLFRTMLRRDSLYLFDGNQDRLDSLGIQFFRCPATGPESGMKTALHVHLSDKAQTITLQQFRNDTLRAEQTVRIGACTRTLLNAVPRTMKGAELPKAENAPVNYGMEMRRQYLSGEVTSESMDPTEFAISDDMLDFFRQLTQFLPGTSIFHLHGLLHEFMESQRWRKKADVRYVICSSRHKPILVRGDAGICDPGDYVIVRNEKTGNEEVWHVLSLYIPSPYSMYMNIHPPRLNSRYALLRRALPEELTGRPEVL